MEALVDATRTLVLETSAGRLGAAALQTPLWGTWTMDRFGTCAFLRQGVLWHSSLYSTRYRRCTYVHS